MKQNRRERGDKEKRNRREGERGGKMGEIVDYKGTCNYKPILSGGGRERRKTILHGLLGSKMKENM